MPRYIVFPPEKGTVCTMCGEVIGPQDSYAYYCEEDWVCNKCDKKIHAREQEAKRQSFECFVGDIEAQKICLEIITDTNNELLEVESKIKQAVGKEEEWFLSQGIENWEFVIECFKKDVCRRDQTPIPNLCKDTWIEFWTEKRDELTRKLKRARSSLQRLTPEIRSKFSNELDIERMKEIAKAYPIKDLLDAEGVKCTGRTSSGWTYLCPLHTEKTGSFLVFKDNHAHCFGCAKHFGDSIALIMHLRKIEFIPALKILNNLSP